LEATLSYTTYRTHNLAKIAGSHFIAGSGDAASAMVAEAKASALADILQLYYNARDKQFDGSDIGPNDVEKAIIYARGKKHTKALRKGVIATSKFGLQVAATVGGATIGSVVPVAGTVLGGVGGAIAGASLGVSITVVDRIKRSGKGIWKWARNTRGEHRKQAAATLMANAAPQFNWAGGGNPADDALVVILQEEYDSVMAAHDVTRLADRLKSN
jgi:hypothetical protein